MPAPNLKAEIQAGLNELIRIRDRVLPVKVGTAAVAHVKENFRSGGFAGQKWADPYRKKLGFKGREGKYGTLLSGNNHLYSSTEKDVKSVKPGQVIIKNATRYAAIHNAGGTITVTARMKRYFWIRYMEIVGSEGNESKGYKPIASQLKLTKRGKIGKSKHNQSLSREAEFWKNMALKKVGSQIRMPKRQFMGSNAELEKIINTVIATELLNFTKNYGIHIGKSR